MAQAWEEPGLLNLHQRLGFEAHPHLQRGRRLRPHVLDGKAVAVRRQALDQLGPMPWNEGSLIEDFNLGREFVRRGWKTKRCSEWVTGEPNAQCASSGLSTSGGRRTLAELRKYGLWKWTLRPILENVQEGVGIVLFVDSSCRLRSATPVPVAHRPLGADRAVAVVDIHLAARMEGALIHGAALPRAMMSYVLWKGPWLVGLWRTIRRKEMAWE